MSNSKRELFVLVLIIIGLVICTVAYLQINKMKFDQATNTSALDPKDSKIFQEAKSNLLATQALNQTNLSSFICSDLERAKISSKFSPEKLKSMDDFYIPLLNNALNIEKSYVSLNKEKSEDIQKRLLLAERDLDKSSPDFQTNLRTIKDSVNYLLPGQYTLVEKENNINEAERLLPCYANEAIFKALQSVLPEQPYSQILMPEISKAESTFAELKY